jgi:hypothetical protein
MKKSELKQLIREVISEVSAGRINASERNKIATQLRSSPVLQGNEKVHKPSEGIKFIVQALDKVGFQLDMVTGDILLGDKGQRLLPFSRRSVTPNQEGEPIQNSRISFSWEVTSVSPTNSLDKKFEVTSYVT